MKQIVILALAALLAGCAMGNRADYRMAITPVDVVTDSRVTVAVVDSRPYVTKRQKHAHWVGTVRSLNGIPYSIGTVSGRPLASDLTDAVVGSLLQSGVMARPASTDAYTSRRAESAEERLLLVDVREWKSHHYMRATFSYDVAVSVIDSNGQTLVTRQAQSDDYTPNIIESGKLAIRQALASADVVAALKAPHTPALPIAAAPTMENAVVAGADSSSEYDACMRRVVRISDAALRLDAMRTCDAAQ